MRHTCMLLYSTSRNSHTLHIYIELVEISVITMQQPTEQSWISSTAVITEPNPHTSTVEHREVGEISAGEATPLTQAGQGYGGLHWLQCGVAIAGEEVGPVVHYRLIVIRHSLCGDKG